MTKNKKTVKSIFSLLIISMIVPSVLLSGPKYVEAFVAVDPPVAVTTGATFGATSISAIADTTDTAISIKNVAKEILRQVVMTVQRRLLAKMTKSMVNWINSGFHGSPLFLENPKSFFNDIAKHEIKTFIDLTGYNSLEFPFGKDFALETIVSYKRQLKDNAQYTLSKAIRDPVLLNNFRSDFEVGGWNGFLINTQYPQNNYLGYRMLATEELARKLDGTTSNAANKVRDTLDQGMGFLSPKTCPSNPSYNNAINEFRRPSFKQIVKFDPPFYDPAFPETKKAYDEYIKKYEAEVAKEKATWAVENVCPGGLVNTTPGSVVASQITNAMSSNFRQTELGAALGSSMSAIFDALLNQFLRKGLNSLASNKNPKPPVDDWTYQGLTLGGPTDGTDTTWDAGPDEVVILDDFGKQLVGEIVPGKSISSVCIMLTGLAIPGLTREACIAALGIWVPVGSTYVPGDIGNTQKELALMDSMDLSNPYVNSSGVFPPGCTSNLGFSATTGLQCNSGITQIISSTWPKIRELDMCLPGPDLGWKERLTSEMDRNAQKLQEKATDSDGEKAAAADLVYKELKFAVNTFRDWINNKMILGLPNAVTYMDAVDEIETLYQQSEELTSKKRTKTQALVRLQAIKAGLDELKILLASQDPPLTQPAAGSTEEKTLIALRKQYNAVRASISNTTSVDETKNELFVSVDKLARLNSLITKCNTERASKITGSEQNMFCSEPIKGGYSHETFINTTGVTHPEIPLVNAKKVYTWRSWLGLKGNQVNIDLKCNIIYKATLVDYKKDLPGLNSGLVEPPPGVGGSIPLGTCKYVDTGMTQDECTASGGSWDFSAETCTRTDTGVTQDNCIANGGTWSS